MVNAFLRVSGVSCSPNLFVVARTDPAEFKLALRAYTHISLERYEAMSAGMELTGHVIAPAILL